MPAELAVAELSSRLAETIRRQRQVAQDRLSRGSWATPPLRWLLTIGALLWFPLLQPILEAYFRGQDVSDWQNVVGLIVAVLGVNYLLKSALFMVIWFLVLWLALRMEYATPSCKTALFVGNNETSGAICEPRVAGFGMGWIPCGSHSPLKRKGGVPGATSSTIEFKAAHEGRWNSRQIVVPAGVFRHPRRNCSSANSKSCLAVA